MGVKKNMNKKEKNKVLNVFLKILDIYEDFNKFLHKWWVFALERQSDNRWTFALKTLINNPATFLFLNTLLFAGLGFIFRGTIEIVLFALAGLNIILFCANILNWKNKLEK